MGAGSSGRRWAGVGGRGILVTMEEAGSEDHQRMFHLLQDQLTTGQQVREAGWRSSKTLAVVVSRIMHFLVTKRPI